MTLLFKVFFLLLLFFLTAKSAYAYLDPGSGSFIIQIVIGAFLGGLVTTKIYYRKIKTTVSNILRKRQNNNHKNNGSKL